MLFLEILKEILEESADIRRRTEEQVRALEETKQEAERNLEKTQKLREELQNKLILSRELIRSSHEILKKRRGM